MRQNSINKIFMDGLINIFRDIDVFFLFDNLKLAKKSAFVLIQWLLTKKKCLCEEYQ